MQGPKDVCTLPSCRLLTFILDILSKSDENGLPFFAVFSGAQLALEQGVNFFLLPVGIADGRIHSVELAVNGTSAIVSVDGVTSAPVTVDTIADCGAPSSSCQLNVGRRPTSVNVFQGRMFELMFFANHLPSVFPTGRNHSDVLLVANRFL